MNVDKRIEYINTELCVPLSVASLSSPWCLPRLPPPDHARVVVVLACLTGLPVLLSDLRRLLLYPRWCAGSGTVRTRTAWLKRRIPPRPSASPHRRRCRSCRSRLPPPQSDLHTATKYRSKCLFESITRMRSRTRAPNTLTTHARARTNYDVTSRRKLSRQGSCTTDAFRVENKFSQRINTVL
jgi:hypothetical protein